MKERVVLFSDAVIAIILTIMVVDFPIRITGGTVDLGSLFTTIAIYFISFCFVANLWFQTAQRFNLVDEVTNKDLVLYLGSLFLLSLVPKATDILIEETSKMTVLIYGILTFLVVYPTQHLMRILTEQAIKDGKSSKEALTVITKRGLFNLGLRLFWLLVGLVAPRVTLVVYMILPILDFLQNAAEHEESEFVQQMGDEQRQFYQEDQRQFWRNDWQKYGTLIRSALSTSGGDGEDGQQPNWWHDFNHKWQDQLNQQTTELNQQIAATEDPKIKATLQAKIDRLHQEQDMINTRLAQTQQRYQQRQSREQDHLQAHLAPINQKISELQNQLTQETEATKQEQLQKEIDKWQKKWQDEVAASQKRTTQTQQKTEERYQNFVDHLPQYTDKNEK